MLVSLIFITLFVSKSLQRELTVEEFAAQPIPKYAQELTGKALEEYVNKKQSFFKAEYSAEVTEKRLNNLMKMEFLHASPGERLTMMPEELDTNEVIPESFDARDKWKNCSSVIGYIRDQSNCGSCWAVSAAETMSDRLCIGTNGRVQTILSDTDILSCCGMFCGDGCDGGYAIRAWGYAKDSGVCSGGRYDTKGNCKPYVFYPCGFNEGQKAYGVCPRDHAYKTPVCKKYCQYGYGKRYNRDKVFVKGAYMLPQNEALIQSQIMRKGPVQAAFVVYEDFGAYKSGIYVHVGGREAGAHAVKVIGWGVENGTKYWTIANSWNTDWGENGYFRILRGVNHCEIESEMVAGTF
uniref:Pept_C1 domain-containing protein n=1 Tax=Haemonchus contortus TaxID=6289 RepID=A0A7I5E5A3_HAECO|nr:Peptidase C1A domain containing protein [Haemonchus contortus]